MRKPMTQEYYAGIKGGRCPACRSAETEGHSIEIDGECALQEMTCLACNATWNATYRLRGYKNLVVAGEPQPALRWQPEEAETDYTLVGQWCWITVGNVSLKIAERSDHVSVEAYEHFKEGDNPELGILLVPFPEGEDDEEDSLSKTKERG